MDLHFYKHNPNLFDNLISRLRCFPTIQNLSCFITDKRDAVVQFTISDTRALYHIMTSFFSGATKWDCRMTGWSDESVFVSFSTSTNPFKEGDDFVRELDYKICLLKL